MTNWQAKTDPYDLDRFVKAQHPLYRIAHAELREGRKRTHWIWFIFPQVEGLGSSSMAQHYAIKSPAEAVAYLAHPLLGVRLLECTETVLEHAGKSAYEIFGSPDDMQFQSSMTLFELAGGGPSFAAAPAHFYERKRDEKTLAIFADWAQA
jgi:uncharacterized protein (DUF1810 family)